MIILLAVAGLLLLFGDKIGSIVAPNSSAGNSGGTSTPVPNKTIPPFYQFDNASTGSVPSTTLAFTPLDPLHPVDRLAVPHNNSLLVGSFESSANNPIKSAISPDLIGETEQTSVAEEQATSWQNNNVGGSNVRQVLA